MKLDDSKERSPAATLEPISIPDHELIRRIGKGSYGEVWLARNIMGVFRAVKIIRRDGFESPSPFRRELAGIKKFEPISRSHDGFVDILQIGLNEAEGYFFYVMEIADDLNRGQDIDPETYVPKTLGKALAKLGRFPVDQCVQTGMALCQALDRLHSHGLVHRDIKPSNIIFINGAPKLADIGLVTDSHHAQSFVGTEGFIPPEGPGSQRADIYSLGKALYEIASGRDRLDFPALPADLEKFSDRIPFLELNEALIRACRQKFEDRYPTAAEMYEDLALLASQKSLRKLRILERRWASLKRNSILALGVLAVVTLIGFPIVREWQHSEEIRERSIGVHSANGVNNLERGDFLGALGEFAEVFDLEKSRSGRFGVNQTRIAAILNSAPRLAQMFFLNDRVGALHFSRDGKTLLAAEKSRDVRLYDVATANELPSFNTPRLASTAFSPDNQFILASSEEGWASIWNRQTGEEQKLPHPQNVLSAKYSHNGKLIATACRDGHTRLWDANTATLIATLPRHNATVRCLAFSPDDRYLVTGSSDETARVWNLSSADYDFFVLPHSDWLLDVAFSPDGKRVLTASHDSWARLWEINSAQEIPTLMRHDGQIAQAGFSPDGSLIFTASMDGTLRLWNAATTRPLPSNHILRHSSSVFSAAFSPDGQSIATGCADGTVRIWDLALRAFSPEIFTGIVNENATAAAIIRDQQILIQDPLRPKTNPPAITFSGTIRQLALSRDGTTLAAHIQSSQQSGLIQLWKIPNSLPFAEIPTTKKINDLRLSPNGAYLSFHENDSGQIYGTNPLNPWPIPPNLRFKTIFDFHSGGRIALGSGADFGIFEKGQPLFPSVQLDGDVRRLAFSTSGDSVLVSQGTDIVTPRPLVLVDFKGGKTTFTRFWHKDGIAESAFHPDGATIATAGEDRRALLWSINPAAELLSPLAHSQPVTSLAFSADGRFLGTCSGTRSIQIWDSETGHPITPSLLNRKNTSRILFTSDRNRFITVEEPLQFSVWKLPSTDLSAEDALSLSRLINSDLGSRGEIGAKSLAEAWNQLRSKIPDLNAH